MLGERGLFVVFQSMYVSLMLQSLLFGPLWIPKNKIIDPLITDNAMCDISAMTLVGQF
jgi:hypothetical protein